MAMGFDTRKLDSLGKSGEVLTVRRKAVSRMAESC